MNTPKLHELAVACYNGACNPRGLIHSLGESINEVPPGKCRDSVDLKIILGQLSYLVGESAGPSFEALQAFKP